MKPRTSRRRDVLPANPPTTAEAVRQLAERDTAEAPPCDWCGQRDCLVAWEHQRLHAAAESTWRAP